MAAVVAILKVAAHPYCYLRLRSIQTPTAGILRAISGVYEQIMRVEGISPPSYVLVGIDTERWESKMDLQAEKHLNFDPCIHHQNHTKTHQLWFQSQVRYLMILIHLKSYSWFQVLSIFHVRIVALFYFSNSIFVIVHTRECDVARSKFQHLLWLAEFFQINKSTSHQVSLSRRIKLLWTISKWSKTKESTIRK